MDVDIDEDNNISGKYVGDLQTDISVGEYGIEGKLYYVEDYGGSDFTNGDEVSGHFLMLHASVPGVNSNSDSDLNSGGISGEKGMTRSGSDDEVAITAELIGSNYAPVTLESDGILISHITSTLQKIKFTASMDGEEDFTKEYMLNGLILNGPAPVNNSSGSIDDGEQAKGGAGK